MNKTLRFLFCLLSVGLLGKAMVEKSEKPYGSTGNPNTVIGVWCNNTEKDTTFDKCSFKKKDCTTDIAVKVECACKFLLMFPKQWNFLPFKVAKKFVPFKVAKK